MLASLAPPRIESAQDENAEPNHARLRQLPVDNGKLLVNGLPVERLAKHVGHAPSYAFDRAALTARMAMLRTALPDSVRLHYTIKVNPMPTVVSHL